MVQLLEYLEDKNLNQFENLMNEKADEIVQRPFKHLLKKKGKEFRQRFVKTFRRWYDFDAFHGELLDEYIRLCHSSSLLIDDIQDRTILRRGLPASYMIYGVPLVLQSANNIIFQLMVNLVSENEYFQDNPKYATQKSRNDMVLPYQKQLLRGQIMEVYWRDNFQCPTVEEYLVMSNSKTGMVFRLAVDAMNAYHERDIDVTGLSDLLGQYFQIRDDYLNLKSTQFYKDKGFCEDLTEGKFSFPIVYAINAYPEDHRILDILKKRPTDVETKLECLKILEELGSFEVTVNKLNKLKNAMQDKIQDLGGNEELLELLETLNF